MAMWSFLSSAATSEGVAELPMFALILQRRATPIPMRSPEGGGAWGGAVGGGGRAGGAGAGALGADALRVEPFTAGDVSHLPGDLPLPRIVHLRHVRTRAGLAPIGSHRD